MNAFWEWESNQSELGPGEANAAIQGWKGAIDAYRKALSFKLNDEGDLEKSNEIAKRLKA